MHTPSNWHQRLLTPQIILELCAVLFVLLAHHAYLFHQIVSPSLQAYWVGNLLPESMSFVLEVGILGALLAFLNQKSRRERMARLHDSCARVLGFLAESLLEGNPFHWSKQINHCSPLGAHTAQLSSVKQKIDDKSFTISALQEKCIIESAHEILPVLQAMIPSAFNLSEVHGVHWVSITQSARNLAALYPFQHPVNTLLSRKIIIGQDEFCLYFPELIEQMISFENARGQLLATKAN